MTRNLHLKIHIDLQNPHMWSLCYLIRYAVNFVVYCIYLICSVCLVARELYKGNPPLVSSAITVYRSHMTHQHQYEEEEREKDSIKVSISCV